MEKTDHRLTSTQVIGYLLLSIVVNAAGNGLTVALNLGSALWTASAVNLSHVLHFDLKPLLLIYGICVVFINIILLRTVDFRRIIGNFLFMIPFSYLVGYTATWLSLLHLNQLNLFIRILLDCFGIVMISVAVSIYQRVNVILHPNDDFMQILRFKYFKGNPVVATLVSLSPPITISIICILLTHQVYAINVGTIFALLFQGYLIGWADTHVFGKLQHQRVALGVRAPLE